MSLFKRYLHQTPTVTVKVDTKELANLQLDGVQALVTDLATRMAKQEEDTARLQRLVTQHDQALTPNLSDTVAIYVAGEVHTRVQADQDNSITNRYNIELIEDDKEHNTQTVKLTPKHRTK